MKIEYEGIKIKCVNCGITCSYARPPSTELGGPIDLAFRKFCSTFKCSKCNHSV